MTSRFILRKLACPLYPLYPSNLFWAIPVNYITCVLVGTFLAGSSLSVRGLISEAWIGFAALQGILLAVNFYLLAATAQGAGVAIAALASRLSVAIPSLLAFLLYGDSLTIVKIARVESPGPLDFTFGASGLGKLSRWMSSSSVAHKPLP